MSNDALAAEPDSPRRRLRFSLLTLLVLFAAVSLLLAWLVQPDRVVATALFDVARTRPSVIAENNAQKATEADYELLRKTQIALLKSDFLLQSAVRDPGIAGLSIFRNQPDQVAWLKKHLEVDFPEDGEILSIKLRGAKAQTADLDAIVDAVAESYKKEVLGSAVSQQLSLKDMLERSLQHLNSQIKRKYEDYLDIAKGMGRTESTHGDIQQQIDVKRIERIDEELMRLENDQLKAAVNGADKDVKVTQQRIAQLQKRQQELEKTIANRGEKSVDLITRQAELEQLQQMANELSIKLEHMDIEAQSPHQIRQVQQAIATPDE